MSSISRSALSRRAFLGTSLKAGAAAAAAGLGGDLLAAGSAGAALGAGEASAGRAGAAPALRPPATPALKQTFFSRPDLTPPGVSISASPNLSGYPAHIFLSPFTIVPGLPASLQGLMITDLAGNLVWWKEMPLLSAKPFNFRVQTYQGRPVITWYQGDLISAPNVPGGGMPGRYGGSGTGVIYDDTYSQIGTVHAQGWGTDLHEFIITSEDTALVTAYETLGNIIVGHAQEVGVNSKELVWDWKSYPEVKTHQSYSGTAGDYFHINSIDIWPGAARDVLISSRNTCAVYLLSRKTKQIIWRLGGKSSSFHIGAGTAFSYQHDARPLADGSGLSLFDDASSGVPERQSWGKVITLDQTTRTASLRHEFSHPVIPFRAGNSGSNQLLPNGGHFVGWGSAPYFSAFAPSGAAVKPEIVLDGRLPANFETYRALMFNWTGRPPVSELAAAVHTRTSGEQFTAYVSWNGATQVTYYEVAAGPAGKVKTVTGAVRRTGFETAIPFTSRGATEFEVSAYTAKGALLGRTKVVGVTR